MQKVVLITGISSGFGKCTSEYLAQKGHVVYGISRKDINAHQGVNVLKADVRDEAAIKLAVDTVLKKEGRIDVLVNNAGIDITGPVEFGSAEDIKLQMDTNFMGTVNLIQAVLPAMRSQKSGMIFNMSSICGLMGLPYWGYYCASKFAIEGLSEALRMELKQFNIKVVVIRPGDHATECTNNRIFDRKITDGNPYFPQYWETMKIIEKGERGGGKPMILAQKLERIIRLKNPRPHYVIASAEEKLAVVLKRFLPDPWFSAIIGSHYGIK